MVTTDKHQQRQDATINLSAMLKPGETIYLARRGTTRRENVIIEVSIAKAGTGGKLSIGQFVGPIIGRPYLYKYDGVLMADNIQADAIVAKLSQALYGNVYEFQRVWL